MRRRNQGEALLNSMTETQRSPKTQIQRGTTGLVGVGGFERLLSADDEAKPNPRFTRVSTKG